MSPQRERDADRELRSGVAVVVPCWYCHAPDCRDAAHARGCPKLPPVTRQRLLALIRATEEAWAVRRRA